LGLRVVKMIPGRARDDVARHVFYEEKSVSVFRLLCSEKGK
jgi:hypothetical protein